MYSPDWSDSVSWASSCKVRGHWFDSRSGPHACFAGLVPSQGAFERQPIDDSLSHQCFSPSFSPSLPLSLKIKNKILNKQEICIKIYI